MDPFTQVTFVLNAGSVGEAASLLLSSLGPAGGEAADGGGGSAPAADGSVAPTGGGAPAGSGALAGGVRLTRAEAARVLQLRSDLALTEELADLFEGIAIVVVDDDGALPRSPPRS